MYCTLDISSKAVDMWGRGWRFVSTSPPLLMFTSKLHGIHGFPHFVLWIHAWFSSSQCTVHWTLAVRQWICGEEGGLSLVRPHLSLCLLQNCMEFTDFLALFSGSMLDFVVHNVLYIEH
jgi:hypothetical protein